MEISGPDCRDPQVKWSRVPDLVEKRKVFLKAGWAYVPSRQQSSIVFQEFDVHLEKALEVCCVDKSASFKYV